MQSYYLLIEVSLCTLPPEDNNAVFNLCRCLCSAYERKAFLDGLQYGTERKESCKALRCAATVCSQS